MMATLCQTVQKQQNQYQTQNQNFQQNLTRIESQIADVCHRRESGQLPSQAVASPRNNPPGFYQNQQYHQAQGYIPPTQPNAPPPQNQQQAFIQNIPAPQIQNQPIQQDHPLAQARGPQGENNPKPKPKIYKAKDKAFHDKHIHRKIFQVHNKVWLFNSRLRENLKSRWDDPYTVVKACDNGAVIILDPKTGHLFTVNGQSFKFCPSDLLGST
ncbi:hypothetical protein Taro_052990 [Colocasia esculenta]|uniref:Uncharacterized protein n=1 Tax=Colocasia esculenta TaxID=4460 RepID=A0A843XKW1_COLES|nr:hypothetical protein [Colocasia esculenta]